jgi:hypothetical protein
MMNQDDYLVLYVELASNRHGPRVPEPVNSLSPFFGFPAVDSAGTIPLRSTSGTWYC